MQHPEHSEARRAKAVEDFAIFVRTLPIPYSDKMRLLDLAQELALSSFCESSDKAYRIIERFAK